MKTIRLSIATVTTIALAAVAAPSFAQVEIAPSEFTIENVRTDAPFVGLPIDRQFVASYLEDIAAFLARFDEESLTELQQRCVVITENADLYDEASVQLCEAVLEAAVGPA